MSTNDNSHYYIPESSWYPVWAAFGVGTMMYGLANWLNQLKAGEDGGTHILFYAGFTVLAAVLVAWYGKVIAENHEGLANAQLKKSYVWGMSWFIFSEVMFFAAFFGALFYTRNFVMVWLGGEGGKGITGDYLWPAFQAVWPIVENPDPSVFPNPGESMAAPPLSQWGSYLPFWNTAILLSSSVTVHMAHTAIKNGARGALKAWLGITVLLGIVFLFLQVEEYMHAYSEMGLTLGTGIYGSTFFLLTGFHGFHVTLGTFILAVQLVRAFKGHFSHDDQFGFEAASWYWHFVDVVWVFLFFFVYIY
ncbi:MAG: cytochrome c oxidase subunit 3 [Pseudomonadales bacterium]|nr:cytochrome c oxidase subunit 3 [Pseudomonadales bacterium]